MTGLSKQSPATAPTCLELSKQWFKSIRAVYSYPRESFRCQWQPNRLLPNDRLFHSQFYSHSPIPGWMKLKKLEKDLSLDPNYLQYSITVAVPARVRSELLQSPTACRFYHILREIFVLVFLNCFSDHSNHYISSNNNDLYDDYQSNSNSSTLDHEGYVEGSG